MSKEVAEKGIGQKLKRNLRISRYVIYKETLVDFNEQFWSFIGAFFGIGLIALLQSSFLNKTDHIFLIGSFGASSVLIFGAIQSPMAQPRNLLGGHIISAIIGVTIFKLFPDIIWITAPPGRSHLHYCDADDQNLASPRGSYCLNCSGWYGRIKGAGVFLCAIPSVVWNLDLTDRRPYF